MIRIEFMLWVVDCIKGVCKLRMKRRRGGGAAALENKTCCFLVMNLFVNSDIIESMGS